MTASASCYTRGSCTAGTKALPSINSMTAFARESESSELGVLTVELRTVNHRYLDVQFRLPDDLRPKEPLFRQQASAALGRGKVECNLRFKAGVGAADTLCVNERLVDQLLEVADKMAHRLHSSHHPSIMDILRWPGVLETTEQDFTPVQAAALELFERGLDSLVELLAEHLDEGNAVEH